MWIGTIFLKILQIFCMYMYVCVLEFFLQWINDSPRVEGNSVAAELRLRRAVTSAECRVTTRQPQDCEENSFTEHFNNPQLLLFLCLICNMQF